MTHAHTAELRPTLPSEYECINFYIGLPSRPRLLGRSSPDPWTPPSGRFMRPRLKTLRPVGPHKIHHVWERGLSERLVGHLNGTRLAWTSLDVVRIGYVDGNCFPVIIWIGVRSPIISIADGTEAAFRCHELVQEFGLSDVHVELRLSAFKTLDGPKLLNPINGIGEQAELQRPFTAALGFAIASRQSPYKEGTSTLFMAEGGERNRLLLLTARHVLLPDPTKNATYERKNTSAPRYDVVFLGQGAFETARNKIKERVGSHHSRVSPLQELVDSLADNTSASSRIERQRHELEIAQAVQDTTDLKGLLKVVDGQWSPLQHRILGHVLFSPPLQYGLGPSQYTSDFAVAEVHTTMVDHTTFLGNVIDLGTQFSPYELKKLMHPHPRSANTFKFPANRLLRLHGLIPKEKMIKLPHKDEGGEECLLVMKQGAISGLTVGRANDIVSVTRQEYKGGPDRKSREWVILGYDTTSPFSTEGDSGAVVVDGQGRIGGMITGGVGSDQGLSIDLTYVTPMHLLLEGIRAKFPNVHLNPQFADDGTLK